MRNRVLIASNKTYSYYFKILAYIQAHETDRRCKEEEYQKGGRKCRIGIQPGMMKKIAAGAA